MDRKPEPELAFKPLSDGLGFHPFADGLPYAPVRKTPTPQEPLPQALLNPLRTSGAGAITAGPPRFSSQLPKIAAPMSPPQQAPLPRISVPVVNPPLPGTPVPALFANPKPAAATEVPSLAAASLEPTFGLVYLIKRVLAFCLDSVFNVGLCAAALGGGLWKQGLNPEILLGPGMVLFFGLFLIGFNWAILTAQEVAFGTTLFKRIFGLGLQGGATEIFLRSFFFLPSVGFCGVGLLWALIDRRRRCWHDLVVNLQPIEIARL